MAASGRSRADDALVAALAGGATVAKAAERAGVGERTAYRRLADPAFAARVTAARAALVERAVAQMSAGATEAAVVLRRLLRSGTDREKLGAARALLQLLPALQNATVFEARMAALEKRISEQEGKKK